jgi:hypothetical protein
MGRVRSHERHPPSWQFSAEFFMPRSGTPFDENRVHLG